MAAELRAQIATRLDEVKDPCSVASGHPMGLTEMGLVASVDLDEDGRVAIVLRLTSPFCEMIGFLKASAIEKVADLPGVAAVTVETDSGFDWSPEHLAPHRQRERAERLTAMREDAAAHRTLLPLTPTRRETTP